MGKGKRPRTRKDVSAESADAEEQVERQTQEKAGLVPPARRPPTAVGAETPPPPPPEPPLPRRSPLPERRLSRPVVEREQSALVDFVQAIRLAMGALLDLADAAVDVVRQQIERRV